jgi:hypothetical protein
MTQQAGLPVFWDILLELQVLHELIQILKEFFSWVWVLRLELLLDCS